MPWIIEKRYFSLDDPREPLSPPSHAAASVPMGGYAFSSTVTRGVHVHHSDAGTWFMTPETCLPQPHHVILLHVSQAAFLHILASVYSFSNRCVGWEWIGQQGDARQRPRKGENPRPEAASVKSWVGAGKATRLQLFVFCVGKVNYFRFVTSSKQA